MISNGMPECVIRYESSEKNFGNDPRSEIVNNQDRAVNQIDKGTKVTVKGVGKARKQTATWF